MSTTMPAPAARQAAVLAAIAALHVGAYVLVAAGLGLPPDLFRVPEEPITLLLSPAVPTPQTRPIPFGVLDFESDPVVPPVLEIPVVDDATPTAVGTSGAEKSEAGIGPALSAPADRMPALRMRDARLQALIDRCYPSGARRLGQEGRGVARIDVDATGRASGWQVEQSTGFPQLDPGMGCVARQLQFEPGRRDGRAIEATVLMPIAFQLR